MDDINYHRRNSTIVKIGNLLMGGTAPIRVQSMANRNTLDTEACVSQAIRIIDAGGELVRFTAQGVREAENLGEIRKELHEAGYDSPLVADIHFNPKAAEAAANYVEKVRINPGNYVDRVKTFSQVDYTEGEYQAELSRIRDRFVPFLRLCRLHGTAIRIGVNHGSLSDRIMSRYGDTPRGMVESCMEFLRLCQEEQFTNVVISMKASNTVVMVESVRLLVEQMEQEQMAFPLHLGVTEAGEGEDGRIKSAVGIGALLADGIGDTIRVSLSEEPEMEIPVARKIVDYIQQREGHSPIDCEKNELHSWSSPVRRIGRFADHVSGEGVPLVLGVHVEGRETNEQQPDLIFEQTIVTDNTTGRIYPVFSVDEMEGAEKSESSLLFLWADCSELTQDHFELMASDRRWILLLNSRHQNPVGELKSVFHKLQNHGCETPVILALTYHEDDLESLQLKSSMDAGAIFLSGFGDGLFIINHSKVIDPDCVDLSFSILQATRLRMVRTEYISCPGCGRTLYDLQSMVGQVKQATKHLKGLKIAVMGCIVNGPGEMADADYGVVGSGRGEVDLYKGKQCVAKRISADQAIQKMLQLIDSDTKNSSV